MGMFSDIGMGLGAVVGGMGAKSASKKAAKAQVAAAQQGIGEVGQQWDYTKGIYQPWMTAGQGALSQYGGLVGLEGADKQQLAIQQLKESPYYQQLYSTGEEALLQNASATGGLRGGNTQGALANFGRDTLAQVIQQQLGNLGPGMEMGFGATGQLGTFGQQKASDISNLYLGQGQARAADYMRRAAINMQQMQGLGQAIGGAADFAAGGFGAPGTGFNWGSAMKSAGYGNN